MATEDQMQFRTFLAAAFFVFFAFGIMVIAPAFADAKTITLAFDTESGNRAKQAQVYIDNADVLLANIVTLINSNYQSNKANIQNSLQIVVQKHTLANTEVSRITDNSARQLPQTRLNASILELTRVKSLIAGKEANIFITTANNLITATETLIQRDYISNKTTILANITSISTKHSSAQNEINKITILAQKNSATTLLNTSKSNLTGLNNLIAQKEADIFITTANNLIIQTINLINTNYQQNKTTINNNVNVISTNQGNAQNEILKITIPAKKTELTTSLNQSKTQLENLKTLINNKDKESKIILLLETRLNDKRLHTAAKKHVERVKKSIELRISKKETEIQR